MPNFACRKIDHRKSGVVACVKYTVNQCIMSMRSMVYDY